MVVVCVTRDKQEQAGANLVLISYEFSDAMTCLSTPILLS